MSKTWIDERPLEDIIRTSTPNPKFKSQVEDILMFIDIEAQFKFKLYKSNSKSTLYDYDLTDLAHKKKQLEQDYKREDEKFIALCKTYEQYAKYDKSYKEESEEDYEGEEEEEEEIEMTGQKDFQANKKGKPNPKDEKKEKIPTQKEIDNVKNNMANAQDRLMTFQKELDTVAKHTECYELYQKMDVAYFNEMKKLIGLYEKNKDREFLIQGIYYIVAYTHRMKVRNVSKDACKGEENKLCETHYLPILNKKCSVAF